MSAGNGSAPESLGGDPRRIVSGGDRDNDESTVTPSQVESALLELRRILCDPMGVAMFRERLVEGASYRRLAMSASLRAHTLKYLDDPDEASRKSAIELLADLDKRMVEAAAGYQQETAEKMARYDRMRPAGKPT